MRNSRVRNVIALVLSLLCTQVFAGELTLLRAGGAASGVTPTIAHVASYSGTSFANTVTVNATACASGDKLVAFAQYDTSGSNGIISWPSGFTQLDTGGINYFGADAWYACGATVPSFTIQPASDTAVFWTVTMEEYSGVASSPINAHSLLVSGGSQSITATPVTTTVANAVVVYGTMAYNSAAAITAISTPSTFTARGSSLPGGTDSLGSGQGNKTFDKAVAAAGSVASQTATTTGGTAGNAANIGAYVALAP